MNNTFQISVRGRKMPRIYTSRPAADRFWEKVSKSDGCWEWTGAISQKGYGNFWDGARYVNAHKFSWEFQHGKAPDRMCVCHVCDNPKCVRPDHLFIGSYSDNMQDCSKKGRLNHYFGESSPAAKLTEAQVLEIRRAHAQGARMSDLARRYGLTQSSIALIVRGINWSHLCS